MGWVGDGSCPLCGSEGEILHKRLCDRLHGIPGIWAVSRCDSCGFAWLSKKPQADKIDACYVEDYFTHRRPSLEITQSRFKQALRTQVLSSALGYKHLSKAHVIPTMVAKAILKMPLAGRKIVFGLGDLLPPFKEGGKLLDIGCGNGLYLALMRELGWEVAGIEADKAAARQARDALGVEVFVGGVDEAPYALGSFDVVTMNHVLEHVGDPIRFLREAGSLLKENGCMIITVPNMNSLGHRLFGEYWYALDPPRHLCGFAPQTLRLCLERAGGLEIISLKTPTRIAGKIFRRSYCAFKTGSFFPAGDRKRRRIPFSLPVEIVFKAAEMLGNPLMKWGEEVLCVARKVKRDGL